MQQPAGLADDHRPLPEGADRSGLRRRYEDHDTSETHAGARGLAGFQRVDELFDEDGKLDPLKVSNHIPWRRPMASPNYLISSHVGTRTTAGSAARTPASSTMW